MNVEQIINQTIAKETGLEESEIAPDSHFQDDLNISETEILEILAKIEEKLSLEIPAEEIEDLETVQELIDSIKDHLNDLS